MDDWLEIFNSGWREDGQIYSDSESGEDNSTAIKRQLDSDEAYSDDMRGDSPDSEEDSSDEDASSDESDDIPLQVEATRRSQRDAAQKKVDYSKQEEYNEDDEDMSDGALTESESGFSAANSAASKSRSLGSNGKTAKSRPKAANKRSQASPSADNMHADEETEEEFIEGGVREEDLRPEQFHCRVRVLLLGAEYLPWLIRNRCRTVHFVKRPPRESSYLNLSRKRNENARKQMMMATGPQILSENMDGKHSRYDRV